MNERVIHTMAKRNLGNLLLVQSGGPTHVINQSLAGAVEEAMRAGRFDRVYGADHGMHGVMERKFFDLTAQPKGAWSAIARTPSAALGTARRKLSPEEMPQAMENLADLGVTCLIGIGGNDSAENAYELGQFAAAHGRNINVIGVPKTVDNDLTETDHCPGYGSAARFLALSTMSTARDAEAMGRERPITIIEAMGRNSGWLPLAAALGKREDRDAPHIVCTPERSINESRFLGMLEEAICKWGFAVAVVSENVKGPNGPLGSGKAEYVDEFGHAYYPSPAEYLAKLAARRLKHRVRFEKPGTIARSMVATTSKVDAAEAYMVGREAARHAVKGRTGVMVTLVRTSEKPYRCDTGLAPLEAIAGKERLLPEGFVQDDETGLPTQAFYDYAMPLIGAPLPRFARLR